MWFMRQAGRSLPEYRALRERHGFFELAGTPELCAEVTLQPVRRHDVDAAVLFADIMTPVVAMGLDVKLVEGVGPMLEHPIRTAADVDRLRPALLPEATLEAIRLVRWELPAEKALVGFCGAPFTVACYLVEGRGSRDFLAAKELMYREPEVWHALLERLARELRRLRQGAGRRRRRRDPALRLLGGHPQPAGLRGVRRAVLAPRSRCGRRRRRSTSARAPRACLRRCATRAATSSASTGGSSWTGDGRLSALDRGVQGNLDPAVLLAPWPQVEEAARDVLRRADGRRGHIFNLGHGVLPQTDPDVLTRLCAFVQEETA